MFPNKIESILLIVSFVAIQVLLVAHLSQIGITWRAGNPIIYILVSILLASVVVWFSLRKMQLKFEQLFHSNQNSFSSVIAITIVPLVMVVIGFQILISNYFTLYYSYFPNETAISENINQMMNSGLLGFLSICLVAPLVEEIVFRGVVLRGLLSNYSKVSALLFSSVLFSVFHLNPDQLFHTLVFGLFLGWIYIETFSLWPSMMAHILFNIGAYMLNTTMNTA